MPVERVDFVNTLRFHNHQRKRIVHADAGFVGVVDAFLVVISGYHCDRYFGL
jgi:hypothetical protein